MLKKIYIPVFAILFFAQFTASSQNEVCKKEAKTITLLQDKIPTSFCDLNGSNSHLYLGRDYVDMLPGFQYIPGNGKHFEARVDNSLVVAADYYSPADVSIRDINVSLPVGTIPGAASVTPTGAAIYTIPIHTPPGTGGMQPNVALVYNSQSGNGVAGCGWNISGLSAITRMPKTIYHDGSVGAVNLNNNDIFGLDGNRLIVTNGGTYGANGTIYHTEIETFNQVESKGSQGNGPEWFEVKTKEGLTMEYGNTNDSRFIAEDGSNTVIFWRVNKIYDQNNNYIEFKYNNDKRESRIEEINYTGNSSMLPYNSIKFYYSIRNDKNQMWIAGQSINSNLLLRMIRIYAEDILVKEYEMKYAENFYSQLTEIIEYEQDRTAYNSTVFEYGEKGNDFQYFSTQPSSGSTQDFFPGDYNNDGLTDLLGAIFAHTSIGIKYHTGYNLYLNNGNSFSSTPNSSYQFPSGEQFEIVSSDNKKTATFDHSRSVFSSDFNGDGKDDVVTTVKSYDGNYYRLDKIQLYYSQGSSFASPVNILPPTTNNIIYPNLKFYYLQGDFDGDGVMDIITILSNKSSYTATIYYPLNSLIGQAIINWDANSLAIADDIRVMDFNGDGKQDIMVINDNLAKIYTFENSQYSTIAAVELYSSNYPTENHIIHSGDFNGDGKTDLLSSENGSDWSIYFSTGLNFWGYTLSQSININTISSILKIGDYNGDGNSDIMYAYDVLISGVASTSKINIYYSTGKATDLRHQSFNYDNILGNIPFIPGDFNGDGKSDEINRIGASNPLYILSFNRNGKDHLLTNIANGYNFKTEFNYNSISKGNYTKGNSASYPLIDFQKPMYVVSNIITPDGGGSVNSVVYYYNEAIVHAHGKGFLGFRNVTSISSNANRQTTSTYEINPTFFNVSQKSVEVKNLSNNLISSVNYTSALHDLGNKRFFSYVQSTTATDHITGIATTENFTYDAVGNLRNYQSITGTNNTQIINDYNTFGSWWIPSRLISSITTNQFGSEPSYSRTISYTYDNKGQLENKITDPGKAKQVTFFNRYLNSFGNISSTAISSGGLHGWLEEFEFDSKGRFVTRHSTFLGSTLSEYEPAYGNITKHTSVDGLISTYQYDAFGRPVTTYTPQGNTITTSYNWVTDNNPANAVYFTETKAPGVPNGKTYYDILGNPLKQEADGYVAKISTEKNYNNAGQLISETQPHSQSEAAKYINYTYNNTYNYLENIDNNGLITTQSISGKTKTITNPAGQQFTKTIDDAGNLSNATSPGGNVTYTYHSSGLPKTITAGSNTTTIEYDEYGRQKKLTDPDAGTTEYEYNAFGDLIMQLDANGNKTELTYDHLRRIELKAITDKNNKTINIKYTYVTSGNGLGNIKKIEEWGTTTSTIFEYDKFSRLIKVTENIDGKNFVTQYEYDNFGNITKVVYPSGYTVLQTYDPHGYLNFVSEQTNALLEKIIYNTAAMNARNQYTRYDCGKFTTKQSYNVFGMLEAIETANSTSASSSPIHHLTFDWNTTTGNPNFRTDQIKTITENFGFDNLNRLTSYAVSGGVSQSVGYEDNGNIQVKSDAGNYVYSSIKPHAVEYIENPPDTMLFRPAQQITYNSFNRPVTITQGGYELEIKYGADQQRRKMVIKKDGVVEKTITYIGNYEKIEAAGDVYEVHYITTGPGLIGIKVRKNGANDTLFYVHSDHLGSILNLTDEDGTTRYEQNFDPWGRERNPADWTYTANPTPRPVWLIRGFTGHEHLDEVGLINMNARLYDPMAGRMLSPDNYVQDATSTQGYNRYSYAGNNPLVYTDPDGNFASIAFVAVAFAGEFLSNGINGYGWSAKTAYNTANTITGNISSVGQFPIYQGKNTTVTAGLDPFAFGISANIYNTQGNFTSGASVGIGLMSGPFANAGASYSARNWTIGISGGLRSNSYSYGGNVKYKGFGTGYGRTHYGSYYDSQGNFIGAQTTGTGSIYWPGGSFQLENDFFDFEKGSEDRWRTGAWELSIGNYSIGSTIYTNDPKNEGSGVDLEGTDLLGNLNNPVARRGAWKEGFVYSSPLWFGYRTGNTVSRIGYSHPLVQDRTQNVIHKYFPPGYQNFYNQYTPSAYGGYGYSGYYNPYTLYGR